jgi:cytoplasmic iron level regulating protein YaaA (DUF328/UPF0246 family)
MSALRRTLIDDPGAAGKLLGVRGSTLEQAVAADRSLARAPELPAHARYTGVVHSHLDVAGLPPAARRRASKSLVIVSGLLGLVGIDDPVPVYRLKMSARVDPLGVLSTWWRPRLTAELVEPLAGRLVLDLLPGEHAKAWIPSPQDYLFWVRARFVRERRRGRDVERRVVGHEAKAAKGLLVRHVLTSRRRPLGAVTDFDGLGYQFDERSSALEPEDGQPMVLTYVCPD